LGMLSHAIGDVSKAVHYLEDSLAFCARTATYPNIPGPAGVTLPFCWSARVAGTTSGRRSCWKNPSKSRQTWGCHPCANRRMTWYLEPERRLPPGIRGAFPTRGWCSPTD